MNKRAEKKSETIEVRVTHSEKLAFMDACQRAGVTASHAIRDFIAQSLEPRRRWKTGLISLTCIGVAALAGAAFYVGNQAQPHTPVNGTDFILAHLDHNGDGVLSSLDETHADTLGGDQLSWLVDAGDHNGDGKVDRSELEALTKFTIQVEASGQVEGKGQGTDAGKAGQKTMPTKSQVVVLPSGISAAERRAYLDEVNRHTDLSPQDHERLIRLIEALSKENPS